MHVHSKPRRRRGDGQALVEFALVLPFLLIILFGTIEVSRMMNLYLTIQDVARKAAMYGAMPDATLSRRPAEVAQATFDLLRTSVPMRYSVHSAWADQPPDDVITVDVNHVDGDQYYTKVYVRLTMNFLLLPGRGKTNSGFIPIAGSAYVLNETQGRRRDGKAFYGEERFQIIELAKGNIKKRLEELMR